MGKPARTRMDATSARHAYRRAVPAVDGDWDGDFSIEFLGGERWLDLLGWAQRLLGLSRLHGLRIEAGRGWHLVGRPSDLEAIKPMRIQSAASAIDGAATAMMTSEPANGPLFALLVRSEVRVLDADRMIGMDLVGWGRWVVPMPFVLHRQETT